MTTDLIPLEEFMGGAPQQAAGMVPLEEFGGAVNKEDPADYALKVFQAHGWSKEQAAGIVGNLLHESSLRPGAVGDGGASFGLAQWNGDRRKGLEAFAAARGVSPEDFNTQLDYVNHELQNTETAAGQALKGATDVDSATRIVSEQYERPGKPMMENRLGQARKLYDPEGYKHIEQGEFMSVAGAADLGFGMSPAGQEAQPGELYRKVRGYLGLDQEPWRPSPVLQAIGKEFLRTPPDLTQEPSPEELLHIMTPEELRFGMARGLPLEDIGGAYYEAMRTREVNEGELRRVMGRFVDGYTASLTEGGKKAAFGDVFKPETAWGTFAGEGAYLAGQIVGPFKLIKMLTGYYLFPTVTGLRTTGQILGQGMKEGAVNLGILQGLSRVLPAMIENEDAERWGLDVLSSAKSGALVGVTFPMLSLVPGQGAVGTGLRMATGFAAMDYMRAAPGKWSTLGNFSRAFQTWDDESKKQFASLSYQYLLDLYFARSVRPIRETMAAYNQSQILQEISKLNPQEMEKEIMGVTRGTWAYGPEGEIIGKGEMRTAEPEKPVNQGQVAVALRRATELYGAPFDEGLNDRISQAVTDYLNKPEIITPGQYTGPRTIKTPQIVKEINPDVAPVIEIPGKAPGAPVAAPGPEGGAIPQASPGAAQGPPAGEAEPGGKGEGQPLPPPSPPPEILRTPTQDILQAPEEFQYKLGADAKTGAGLALGDVKKWDEGLSGVLTLWRDPEGKLFVVNGHQRLALAQRTGTPEVNARILDSFEWTKEQARAYGARMNIAEGRGTPVDMAKFMRDAGLTSGDLAGEGVSLTEAKTRQGLALSNLSDNLFHEVALGRVPLERGAIIGEELAGNHPAQDALLKGVLGLEKKGGDVSNEKLRELVRLAKYSPTITENQLNLFGAEELKRNLLLEQAELLSYAKKQLRREKAVFGVVDREKGRLAEAGNVIDPDTNQVISRQAAEALDILDKAAYMPEYESSAALKKYAGLLATGKTPTKTKEAFYAEIKQALRADRVSLTRPGSEVGRGLGKERPEVGVPVPGRGEGAPGGREFREVPAPQITPAEIKRLYPDISEEQAQILAQDPELRAQFAKGNWEALARQKAQAMVSDQGAQGTLEGMGTVLFGEPGPKKLYSGGPDTSSLLTRLKEGTREARSLWADLKTNIREIIAPATLPDAKEVAKGLITMMGRKNEAINQAHFRLLDFRDLFKKTPVSEWGKLAATWQAGGKTGTDLDRAWEVYHEINDALVPRVRDYRDLAYQENYLRQAWRNARDPEFKANIGNFLEGKPFKNYLDMDEKGNPRIFKATFAEDGSFTVEPQEGAAPPAGEKVEPEPLTGVPRGRTLTGGRGYFKEKKIPDWQTGLMLGGVPKFKNLFDLMIWDIGEKNQFIWGNEFIKWAREEGYLEYVSTRKIPQGWARIEDPRGLIRHPYLKEIEAETRPFEQVPEDYDMTAAAKVEPRVMEWALVAPKEAARIINNFLSPGLWGQPFYNLYRNAIDPLRRLGVAFSTYHLRFTMNNSLATGTGQALSKAMGDLFSGDMEGLAQAVKSGALNLTGAQFVKQLGEGKTLAEAFYKGTENPVLQSTLRRFIDSGGTLPGPESMLPMTKEFGKGVWQSLVELGRLHPFKAAGELIDASSKPIMTYGVPFAKLGAFPVLERALQERLEAKYAKMGPETAELAAQREAEHRQGLFDINRHLDNIYGQMNYDALLFNRKVKDMLFFVIKFPGWNIGSGRWLAAMVSGLKNTAMPGQQASEYEKESLRMGLGLVINMGIYSSLLYWFINGRPPEDVAELYTKGVWTGGYTRSGNKEYIRDASYWRDLWGMIPVGQHGGLAPGKPIETVKAKAADIWRIPVEVMDNREAYSGNQIFSPTEPGRWGEEGLNYLGKQAIPYSFRAMAQAYSPWGKFGSFVGWTPTPARLTDTPAMQEMRSHREAESPRIVTTVKQEGREIKKNLMDFVYEGDGPGFLTALRQARAEGQITSNQFKGMVRDGHEILRDPHYGPLRNSFRKLTDLGEAIKVFGLALPEERAALADVMQQKWGRAQAETRRKYRQEFLSLKEKIAIGE